MDLPVAILIVLGAAAAAALSFALVHVALQLAMPDPRERPLVHSLLVAGVAAVVTAGLLIVNFLDHPFGTYVGAIQPSAMRHTLVQLHNLEPGLRVGCASSGRPV